jgi:hypothetical protein
MTRIASQLLGFDEDRRSTVQAKTYFRQVSLKRVRKIMERQAHELNTKGKLKMVHDIFRTEPDGAVIWRGTATDIEDAKMRVRDLALSAPGEYIIWCHTTGEKLVMKAAGANEAPQS